MAKIIIDIPDKIYYVIYQLMDMTKNIRNTESMEGLIYDSIYKGKILHNKDEHCTDCKEYDHNKHCCPRFNKIIRTTLNNAMVNMLKDLHEKILQEHEDYVFREDVDTAYGLSTAMEYIEKKINELRGKNNNGLC